MARVPLVQKLMERLENEPINTLSRWNQTKGEPQSFTISYKLQWRGSEKNMKG